MNRHTYRRWSESEQMAIPVEEASPWWDVLVGVIAGFAVLAGMCLFGGPLMP